VDSTHWDVVASFFDETGTFGPGDIAVGLRVFLYSSSDNTLRYRVSTLTDVSSNPVEVVLEWDDDGSPLDPPANIGAIAAVSTNNLLPEEPSFSQQLLDEPLVTGIRAQTSRSRLDALGGGSGPANQKVMIGSSALAAGAPVSKNPATGKVILADSDGAGTQQFYGVTVTTCAGDGSPVTVQLPGANLAGVLTGLGFAVGDEIFMGETAGSYVNGAGVDSFVGANDSIFKLGIADCAAGVASATVTDLILLPEVVARP